jgi:flagellar capping protein FliD
MSRNRGSSVGVFFGGFISGIIVVILILGIVGMSILKSPTKLSVLAKRFGMTTVVEKTVVKTVTKTVQSIPRGEIAVRQDQINRTFQHLTQSFSDNRLTYEDIQKLSDRLFTAMADQTVSPKEIDDLLRFAEHLGQ